MKEGQPGLSPKESRKITRRKFLWPLAGGMVAATAVGLLSFFRKRKEEVPVPIPLKERLLLLESRAADTPANRDLRELHQIIEQMYAGVFGEKQILAELEILREGWTNLEIPYGRTIPLTEAETKKLYRMLNVIFPGSLEKVDPNLPRISVIRAVLLHEFAHSQVEFIWFGGKTTVEFGQRSFNPLYKLGFKYILGKEKYEVVEKRAMRIPEEEVGNFLEEWTAQLLAEYVNQKMVGDEIYKKVWQSEVFRKSIEPDYGIGAAALDKLLQKFKIPIEELEAFHRQSDPEGFLNLLDVKLSETILQIAEERNPYKLQELVESLP